MMRITKIMLALLLCANIFCQSNSSAEDKNRLFLEDLQRKEKIASEKRKSELDAACESGKESIIAFANKYPNTPEQVQAIRVLRKYNAENDVISNRIAVCEEYVWSAEGDRGWLNEVYEVNRNTVSGGKQYNVFGFATLQNKTDVKIKVKAVVNLNMTKISNLSIIYSASNYSLSEDYYIELLPRQSKSILVLFKNINEGISIGRSKDDHTLGGSLFSMGSENNINSNKPITVNIYESQTLPTRAIESQNRLIAEVMKNRGNIKIDNESQRDVMNKWKEKFLGTNSENLADLRVYFSKKNSTTQTLTIYNENNKLILKDTYDSSGEKSKTYNLVTGRTYTIYVPSCVGPFQVSLKKGITHLIIDSECRFRINHEDEK